MQAVVLTIHLLLALTLILVVLMQRSEGGGLGMGGGGGVMTSRGAATALSKVTWAVGVAFVITSLTLTVLAAHDSRGGSVIDAGGTSTAPATSPAAPASTPGLEGDLLPPSQDAAPAAPPAEEGPAAPPPVQ